MFVAGWLAGGAARAAAAAVVPSDDWLRRRGVLTVAALGEGCEY